MQNESDKLPEVINFYSEHIFTYYRFMKVVYETIIEQYDRNCGALWD